MLVISRKRRNPKMEEFARTTTDVIDVKERKAKRGNGKEEVKLRRRGRRRTRRRRPDEMDDERGDRLGDEVEDGGGEGGGGGGEEEEGEIGDRREDWLGRRVIDGEIGVW